MLQDNPNDPFLYFAMAKELEKKADWVSALEWYERLVKEHPDYTGTYYHLGLLYQREGRLEDAMKTWKNGVQVCEKVGADHDKRELQGLIMAYDPD